MLFIENKYTKTYYSIIEKGNTRNFKNKKEAKKVLGYVETHHIIPKSLGGLDTKSNLVYLTGREHFICHLLLIKMTKNEDQVKMIFAIQNFKHRKKDKIKEYKIGSRIYEMIKRLASEKISEINKGKPSWNKGVPQTPESNKKRSTSLSGRAHSEEHRKNNSLARIGKKRQYSEDGLRNIIEAGRRNKGVKLTQEQRKSRVGNVWWNNNIIETRSKTQPREDFIRGRLRFNKEVSPEKMDILPPGNTPFF